MYDFVSESYIEPVFRPRNCTRQKLAECDAADSPSDGPADSPSGRPGRRAVRQPVRQTPTAIELPRAAAGTGAETTVYNAWRTVGGCLGDGPTGPRPCGRGRESVQSRLPARGRGRKSVRASSPSGLCSPGERRGSVRVQDQLRSCYGIRDRSLSASARPNECEIRARPFLFKA